MCETQRFAVAGPLWFHLGKEGKPVQPNVAVAAQKAYRKSSIRLQRRGDPNVVRRCSYPISAPSLALQCLCWKCENARPQARKGAA